MFSNFVNKIVTAVALTEKFESIIQVTQTKLVELKKISAEYNSSNLKQTDRQLEVNELLIMRSLHFTITKPMKLLHYNKKSVQLITNCRNIVSLSILQIMLTCLILGTKAHLLHADRYWHTLTVPAVAALEKCTGVFMNTYMCAHTYKWQRLTD